MIRFNSLRSAKIQAIKNILSDGISEAGLDLLIPLLKDDDLRAIVQNALAEILAKPENLRLDRMQPANRELIYSSMIHGRERFVLAVLDYIEVVKDPDATHWVEQLAAGKGMGQRNEMIRNRAKAYLRR